jgi:hypothetical protein
VADRALPPGRWRHLRPAEVRALARAASAEGASRGTARARR